MKLPIPQELLDQLSDTKELMEGIVSGLGDVVSKLDQIIELGETWVKK